MQRKPEIADVAIVGAGLVGLAMALALGGRQARPPLDVRLIDAHDLKNDHTPAFDSRASAITLSSRRLLEALGVWAKLEPMAEPIRRIVVTDSGLGEKRRPALLRFGEESGPGPSASIVENRHLIEALQRAVAASPAIEVIANTTVEAFEFRQAHAVLTHAGGSVKTSLVIAADGRSSPARSAAGVETLGWAYGQSAIVTTVEHERPHQGTAEEHFLPAGPFAVLPLKGNRASLVWTEGREDADRIAALDEAGFAAELRTRFGEHLGAVKPEGPRQVYPLSLQIAKRFAARRLALVGDAAHVVHPIAGLGFNLGLRDVAALAECVSDAVRLGLDPGAADVLERYQSWRRLDTVMVAAATDGLNRLFANENRLMRLARDAGLGVVDRLGSLKQVFANEAAGVTGTLPRLLQGEPA